MDEILGSRLDAFSFQLNIPTDYNELHLNAMILTKSLRKIDLWKLQIAIVCKPQRASAIPLNRNLDCEKG